jgi:hypothetical protein
MVAGTNAGLSALRALTRRVFPAQLQHRGLVSALASHLEQSGHRALLRTDGAVETARFGLQPESTAYFCAVEVLRELDPPEQVTVSLDGGGVALAISGRPGPGVLAGTLHLPDRVAAMDGRLSIAVDGDHASMRVWLPTRSAMSGAPYLEDTVGVEGGLAHEAAGP